MESSGFPGMILAFKAVLPYYDALAAVDLAGGRNFRLTYMDNGQYRVEVYRDAGEGKANPGRAE